MYVYMCVYASPVRARACAQSSELGAENGDRRLDAQLEDGGMSLAPTRGQTFENYRHDAFERQNCMRIPGVHKCTVQQSLNRCFCRQRVLEARMRTRIGARTQARARADT